MPEKSHVALTNCFFCGEPDRIILHKRLRDVSQFHGKVIDHEPCAKCAGYMQTGVILISVKDGEQGDNPYRTGGFWVVKDEAIRRMVKPTELADTIIRKRMCFVPNQACKVMGLPGSEKLQ